MAGARRAGGLCRRRAGSLRGVRAACGRGLPASGPAACQRGPALLVCGGGSGGSGALPPALPTPLAARHRAGGSLLSHDLSGS